MARSRLRGPAVLAAIAALLVGGCGSGSESKSSHSHAASASRRTAGHGGGVQVVPQPGPTGIPAGPVAVRVIKAWSTALRHGDIHAAAAFFKLPSELINGTGDGVAAVIVIHNLAQAEGANESLPCGAEFISADQRGPYVNALFRLTGRPGPGGTNCGTGAGLTARTNFLIRDGRIIQWIRAPDDPGDNAGASSGGPVV
jgi:hypothetical protein